MIRRPVPGRGLALHRNSILLATVAAAWLIPAVVPAQDDFEKVVYERIDAMAFPRGVRSIGMGLTGTCDDNDPANVYYNPAVLAYGPGIGLNGGTNNWTSGFDISDIGISAAYRASPASRRGWHVGAGVRYVTMDFEGSDELQPTAIGTPPPIHAFNDWYLASAMAGGYSPGNFDLAAGFAVKYLDAGQIEGVDFSTWTYDVGAMVKYTYHRQDGLDVVTSGGVSGLSLGAGDGGPDEVKPVEQLRAGLGIRLEAAGTQESGEPIGWQSPILAVAINGEVVDYVDTDRDPGSSVGVEMAMANILSIRYGYADKQYTFDYGQTFGGSLGYGWNRAYFRFDLAMAFETDLGKNISAIGFLLDIDI
jgi:hypothetical protein